MSIGNLLINLILFNVFNVFNVFTVKSEDPYCLNGNRWDIYCCNPSCIANGTEYCGMDECGFVDGKYNQTIDENCCTGAIFDSGLSCTDNDAPCLITGTIPPAYQPTEAPTAQTPSPTSSPTSKIKYYNEDWFIPAVGGGVIVLILIIATIRQLLCNKAESIVEPESQVVVNV